MDFINILAGIIMSTNGLEPHIERVRHPFAARHVQLLARKTLSPGFISLTLGGDQLTGFDSVGFDDHIKLILPQEGQDKPNLPRIVDGRPHIDGKPPTMRDYTPLRYDASANTIDLEFAVHSGGPALDWALTAPLGQWAGIAGPRVSMLPPDNMDWYVLLGDDSAVPAIERRLSELSATARAIVRVQLDNLDDQRKWSSPAALDVAFVPSLQQAVDELVLPSGRGFVWGAGEKTLMAAIRSPLLDKGIDKKSIRLSADWKQDSS